MTLPKSFKEENLTQGSGGFNLPGSFIPEDIEEMKRAGGESPLDPTLKSQIPKQPEKKGFLRTLGEDLVRPLGRGAVNLIQAGQIIGGGQPEETFKLPFLGETKPIGQEGDFLTKVKDSFGVGIELASFIPLARGASLLTNVGFKGLIKRGFIIGAREGATGLGLEQGGRALQEDKGVGEVAFETGTGALTGAVGGGILGGLTGLIKPTISTLKKLAKGEGITASFSKEALSGRLENSYREILNPTKRQSKIEQRFNKNTPKFLVDQGIVLKGSGGVLDTTQAVDTLTTKAEFANSVFEQLLKSENKIISLDDFAARAKQSVGSNKLGTDRAKALQMVDNEIAAYKEQLGQFVNEAGELTVPLDVFNRIKQDLWSKTKKFGSPDSDLINDTNFLMGHTAKDMIEGQVEDVSIKDFNKLLGDYASAVNLLKNKDKSKLGGKIGQLFNRTIGAIIGSSAGPKGSLIGAIGADQLSKILQDPEISTFFTRTLLDRLREEGGEDIIIQAEKIIGERIEDALNRKLLPSGAIPLGSKKIESSVKAIPAKVATIEPEFRLGESKSIPLPTRKGKSSVEALPAKKGLVGQDPKSKKFIKTFKSTP